MSGLQVVGLGLCTVDILIRFDEMPTWERGGRLSDLCLDGGGPVGTALAAAARLGAKVGFVGTVGNDEMAALKMRLLTDEGIDTSRVVIRPRPETQLILVYVHGKSGERAFAASSAVSADPLKVSELDRDYLTAAQYLHLDGFYLEAALQAARWMHLAGRQVVLDAGKTDPASSIDPGMRELVGLSDFLICGAGFAPALTGEHDAQEAGRAALALGPRVVVQTEGEQGSTTVTETEAFHTPAFTVEVVDTTGAGDVFHGAYLVGLINGWDLRRTALFASAVAALKCTHLGGRAGIPRLEEVRSFSRSLVP